MKAKANENTQAKREQAITLGIDIGLSSIGWALVEDQKKFIDGGVHIFTNGGEDKANATRREKRLKRRQTRRRSMRIRRLIHALAGTAMLPIKHTANLHKQLEKAAILTRKERQATSPSTDPEELETLKKLKDFFDLNPWELRKKAIEGQMLTPQELGRVLYHFAHQRGFPKKSLRTLEGDKKAEEEAKTLKEGSPKDGKIGAEATQEAIDKKAAYPYLGYYLANLVPGKGTPPYEMDERIRSRYTYREMYEAEFDQIWKMQRRHHPALLTPQRKAAIKHILFFQLPLQTPPRGQCTFEPNKKRAYLASLHFEEFRAYQYINNFLAQYGLTTPAARAPFLEKAIAEFLGRKTGITAPQLAKKLQLTQANKDKSNEETTDKAPKRAEFQLTRQLRDLFGPATWDAYTAAEKNERWHIIVNQLKDADSLVKYAKKHWHLEKDKQIAALRKINNTIPKGVGNISEKAICYILPYLRRGYLYDQAVLLGSICKAFGHNFDQEVPATHHWATLSNAEKEAIEQKALHFLETKNLKARDQIIHYLKVHYPQKALYTSQIYHHSHFALPKRHEKLPLPDPTRNPIVNKALIQLRRVVNAIMKKHHLTEIPCIRVELARELKNSPKARKKIESTIKQHTTERAEAYQQLLQNGIPLNDYNIRKYRLWKEVNYTCPFSGRKINIAELYGKLENGDDTVEIEHIRPTNPKDNRWKNLTIALRSVNKAKDKKTPYEYCDGDSAVWEEIKTRVKGCFTPAKYAHFISKEPSENKKELTQREEGLTGYIARETKNYLRKISPKVETTQGGVVSTLRHQWKLNEFLFHGFVCKQADSILKFKGKTITEGTICYVAYREASEGPHTSDEGWAYRTERSVLPQCVVIDIAPFVPAFKGRDFEEIDKDIKECLDKFKKTKTLTDKAEKAAQEKSLKSQLKGYYAEKNDQKKHNDSTKKALITDLEKRVKAGLGKKSTAFHIMEARLQKKPHDVSKKASIHTFYLNPTEAKNRTDHRHHLIDACVIATAMRGDTQRINKASGEGKHSQDRQYNISAPWTSFWEDIKELLSRTLISRDQPLKICTKAKKRVRIPSYAQGTQGKRYRYITAQGLTARGQLCKETFYGQYIDKEGNKKYHVRKPITAANVDKIVDKRIKALVKAHIAQKLPFFEEKKEGNKIVSSVPLLFLPKKGDKTTRTSPIKRVRIAENLRYMRPAKANAAINSWVFPKKNEIAGFYYNKAHKKTPWLVEIVSFWDNVQLASQKKKPLPAKKVGGYTLCFTLKIDDFLLFPPKEWQGHSLTDLQLLSTAQLAPYLYRVQKINKNDNFVFRKHMAATLDNPLEQLSKKCNPLLKLHPIKVSINKLGEIRHWQVLNPILS